MGKNDKKAGKSGKAKASPVRSARRTRKRRRAGTATEALAAPPAAVTGTYADGAPLDQVTYLEAKLILKPDRFTSVDSFRNFGKLVQKTAKQVGVGFIADRGGGPAAANQGDRLW